MSFISLFSPRNNSLILQKVLKHKVKQQFQVRSNMNCLIIN